jgi:DNA-binding ferritin-like protein (Dps family)
MLADVIGVKLPAFTQKMKGDRSSKFSPEQEDKLKKFIRKMAKEAQFCCKSVATIKI